VYIDRIVAAEVLGAEALCEHNLIILDDGDSQARRVPLFACSFNRFREPR
jgi:hypothetical protein